MHILNFLLLLLLPVSISAAAVDRIVYTPGPSENTSNTSPNLQRRDDSITWGPDDETQDACDADKAPEKTGDSEFLKFDCIEILNFNNKFGRYTISGYTDGKWAKINVKNTCCIAVARKDDSSNDFE